MPAITAPCSEAAFRSLKRVPLAVVGVLPDLKVSVSWQREELITRQGQGQRAAGQEASSHRPPSPWPGATLLALLGHAGRSIFFTLNACASTDGRSMEDNPGKVTEIAS